MNSDEKRAALRERFTILVAHGSNQTELRLLDKDTGKADAMFFGDSVELVLDKGHAYVRGLTSSWVAVAEEQPEDTAGELPTAEVVARIDPATGRYEDQPVTTAELVQDEPEPSPAAQQAARETLRKDIAEAQRLMDEKEIPTEDRKVAVTTPEHGTVILDAPAPKPANKPKRKKRTKGTDKPISD